VALETERSRLEAEYDLAPSLPTDELLGELRAALLRASEEKAVEKLKQVLSCVVDTIVVEGRDHIQPYYFVPGVLKVFPSRRRTGNCKNPNAAGHAIWVAARHWGRAVCSAWGVRSVPFELAPAESPFRPAEKVGDARRFPSPTNTSILC
jgi:hypothetical protein